MVTFVVHLLRLITWTRLPSVFFSKHGQLLGQPLYHSFQGVTPILLQRATSAMHGDVLFALCSSVGDVSLSSFLCDAR